MRTESVRRRLLSPVFVAALAAVGTAPTFALGDGGLQNPGFEQAGQEPGGWGIPPALKEAGYSFRAVEGEAKEGKRYGVLTMEKPPASGMFGNTIQAVDAAPFRGKRVRLRAAVRYRIGEGQSPLNGGAMLWLRSDREGGKRGFYGNTSDRPAGTEWQYVEVVGDIEPDARTLNVGMLLLGKGAAHIDDVSLTAYDIPAGEAPEGPRPLSPRGTGNVVAFTKLFGYVRHFYPSDDLSPDDWDLLAVRGMRAAEKAKDANELAKTLTGLFVPVAPEVQVFAGEADLALPAALTRLPAGATPEAVAWKHVGYGGGTIKSAYTSTLIRGAAPGGKLPAGFPADPRKPFEADLGGGVRCRVPLALWAGGARQPAPESAPAPKPSAKDRAVRLAAVSTVWSVFEHFYPYFDAVKVDWNAALDEALTAAATDADELAFHKTLNRLVARAQDGHGRVSLPGAAPTSTAPVRLGWVEGGLAVTAVAPEGSAALKPGDVVVSVDGRPAAEAVAEAERYISGATEGWRRYRSTSELLHGPKDSVVKLEVRPDAGNGPVRTVTLRRTHPAYGEGALPIGPPRPATVEEVRPGIVYVDLGRVTQQEFGGALAKMAAARGVVLDMRGYPRIGPGFLAHLTDKPFISARWCVPTVTAPDHARMEFSQGNWPPTGPAEPRIKGKVVFLTDGRAISYAESVMGIVENYKMGEIVGEATAGTNGNVNGIAVPGGYSVVFTGMKVLKHDGSQHHGVGITPTVPQSLTRKGLAAGKDDQLERAIAVASGGS